MTDEELWNGIVDNLHKHYPYPEFDTGIIEVYQCYCTFDLSTTNHYSKYYWVNYTINNWRVVVDWNSLEQIDKP